MRSTANTSELATLLQIDRETQGFPDVLKCFSAVAQGKNLEFLHVFFQATADETQIVAEGFFFKGLAKRFFLKVWPNLRLSLSCSKLSGKDYPQGLLLQQAIGEGPSAGSSFAASYWGRTIRRVFFCSKLLGKDHPQGLLLQQAIGVGPSAGSSFAASYWERTIRRVFFAASSWGKSIRRAFFPWANQICILLLWGLFLQQAIGYVLVLGFLLFGYWGRTTYRVFFCSKLLGKFHS